jgi:RNA polymerase sigma-70 factor (ECF subfamily)
VVKARRLLPGRWLGLKRPAPAEIADDVGRALVQRWRRGDPTAFADLFRTYRQLVFGVLHHLLPGDPEIEDVVQSAFVEVFRSLDRFEGRSRLSSWIARIALHVGYHHLRRRRSRPLDYLGEAPEADLPDPSPLVDPHLSAERREAIARLYAVLEQIAPRKRTVFILADLQGVSHEEIAEIVGCNLGTVRTRLFYARREFWKLVGEDPLLAQIVPPARAAIEESG